MRLALFLGSLAIALALGVFALQSPAPRGPDEPATAFSAARAMVDVRIIARHPHPVGSVEHGRVRGYLVGRMTALGLNPTLQDAPLSADSARRLARWGGDPSARAVNIVGVLPGTDPKAPAVLIMAHYDTTWTSPGAADDTAGVAAALEAVRAIRSRGPSPRTLIIVFTDAEELGLDGARGFFATHPLRSRIGAVVNMEARGGGGRALMFETGPGNAQTIDLFARAATHATGGATSNSLAVMVYALMPNSTDFTLARKAGLSGVNFAFTGRPGQYHTAAATPEALDQGSVQHMGSQALEAADALLRAPALPVPAASWVYADVFGHIVGHAPQTGWVLLGIAAALLWLFALWGARHATAVPLAEVGRGALGGVWMISVGLPLAQAVRLLAGPQATSTDAYYLLMRRLPWIEAGVVLSLLALALAVLAGRDAVGRKVMAGVVVASVALATILGGINPVVIGSGVVALGLGLWSQGAPRPSVLGPWGNWLGLILLVLVLGSAVQAVAPEAAFLLVWPGLLAAAAAAATALIGARLVRGAAFVPSAIALALGGAWLMGLAHQVFLNIGMDVPGVLTVMVLLVLMLATPLAPPAYRRALCGAAAACLIVACAAALTARVAEPPSPPVGMPASAQAAV
ncbi:M28 family metallopeptidase [soil metagenome]